VAVADAARRLERLHGELAALEGSVAKAHAGLARWRLRPGATVRARTSTRTAAVVAIVAMLDASPPRQAAAHAAASNEHPAVRVAPLLAAIEADARLWETQRRTVSAVTALDYVRHLRQQLAAEDADPAAGVSGRPMLRHVLHRHLASV
jgi:hypothetical protein